MKIQCTLWNLYELLQVEQAGFAEGYSEAYYRIQHIPVVNNESPRHKNIVRVLVYCLNL